MLYIVLNFIYYIILYLYIYIYIYIYIKILLSYSEILFGEYRHIITLGFTLIFAPMAMLANLSRYVKLYLLNKRDISRIRLYSNKQGIGIFGKSSNFEPNDYLRRINKLVSRQITVTLFVCPYLILLIWGMLVLWVQKKNNIENSLITFSPIILITIVTNFIIPYIFISLYYTLNLVNKLDIILSFFSLLIGTSLYALTLFKINGHPGLSGVQSSSLFFIIPPFFAFCAVICIPLIEVFLSNKKLKNKKMISKKEFVKLLLGSRYIDSLKSTAVKCYCVEIVLFWDMHLKLMKLVMETINNNKKDHLIDASGSSDEKAIDIKQGGLPCNTISSPMPSNYDLLLSLNKNIFGSGNDTILYAGCGNSNPNDINKLNNRYATSTGSLNNHLEERTFLTSPLSFYGNEHGNGIRTRGRANSSDTLNTNSTTITTTTTNNINNNNNSDGSYSNNNNNINNEDTTLSVSLSTNSNDIPPRPSPPYGPRPFYSGHKNEGSLSQYSYTMGNGYSESNASEMASLLYHSDTQYNSHSLHEKDKNYPLSQSQSQSQSHFQFHSQSSFNNSSPSHAPSHTKSHAYSRSRTSSSATLVNNLTLSSNRPGHIRNNSLKNSNTEIYYELFNIDPEHVELPMELWNDYKNLYYSFVSDRSLATVNLDTETVTRINRSLQHNNYTIDMFFPVIAETVDLIYQNLYPKLLMK